MSDIQFRQLLGNDAYLAQKNQSTRFTPQPAESTTDPDLDELDKQLLGRQGPTEGTLQKTSDTDPELEGLDNDFAARGSQAGPLDKFLARHLPESVSKKILSGPQAAEIGTLGPAASGLQTGSRGLVRGMGAGVVGTAALGRGITEIATGHPEPAFERANKWLEATGTALPPDASTGERIAYGAGTMVPGTALPIAMGAGVLPTVAGTLAGPLVGGATEKVGSALGLPERFGPLAGLVGGVLGGGGGSVAAERALERMHAPTSEALINEAQTGYGKLENMRVKYEPQAVINNIMEPIADRMRQSGSNYTAKTAYKTLGAMLPTDAEDGTVELGHLWGVQKNFKQLAKQTREGRPTPNAYWARQTVNAIDDFLKAGPDNPHWIVDAPGVSEPTLAPGMTRMYRGETPTGAPFNPNLAVPPGSWFSTDKEMASHYGPLHYVDLSHKEMMGTALDANHPDGTNFILDQELASRKQPLTGDPLNARVQAAQDIASTLNEANANYGAGMRSQDFIKNVLTKPTQKVSSTYTIGNIINQIRQGARWMLDPSKPHRIDGYNDEEVAGLNQILHGLNPVQNLMRLIGRLAPDNALGLWGAMGGAGLALSGQPAGLVGPMGAIAGMFARKIGSAAQRRQINNLDKRIRLRSPLGTKLNSAAEGDHEAEEAEGGIAGLSAENLAEVTHHGMQTGADISRAAKAAIGTASGQGLGETDEDQKKKEGGGYSGLANRLHFATNMAMGRMKAKGGYSPDEDINPWYQAQRQQEILPHGVPRPGPTPEIFNPGAKPIPNTPSVTGLAQPLPPSEYTPIRNQPQVLPSEFQPRPGQAFRPMPWPFKGLRRGGYDQPTENFADPEALRLAMARQAARPGTGGYGSSPGAPMGQGGYSHRLAGNVPMPRGGYSAPSQANPLNVPGGMDYPMLPYDPRWMQRLPYAPQSASPTPVPNAPPPNDPSARGGYDDTRLPISTNVVDRRSFDESKLHWPWTIHANEKRFYPQGDPVFTAPMIPPPVYTGKLGAAAGVNDIPGPAPTVGATGPMNVGGYDGITGLLDRMAAPIVAEHQQQWTPQRAMGVLGQALGMAGPMEGLGAGGGAGEALAAPSLTNAIRPTQYGAGRSPQITTPQYSTQKGDRLPATDVPWPQVGGYDGEPSIGDQAMTEVAINRAAGTTPRGILQSVLSPTAQGIGQNIGMAMSPIEAYHGSPYDFNAFDSSKIGTGEGAQMFGYGHYLAENESVARDYRDKLAGSDARVTAIDPKFSKLADHANRMLPPKATPTTGLEQLKSYAEEGGEGSIPHQVMQAINSGKLKIGDPGHMYQVEIGSEPEHFLDWDKPLSQQSPQVQQAFKPFADEAAYQMHGTDVPADFSSTKPIGDMIPILGNRRAPTFSASGREQGAAALSQEMQTAGIPGIRYLDEGSRAAGEGTHNYVVFDPSIIKIMRKYGILGPVFLAGASGATQKRQNGGYNDASGGGTVQDSTTMFGGYRSKRGWGARRGGYSVSPLAGGTSF